MLLLSFGETGQKTQPNVDVNSSQQDHCLLSEPVDSRSLLTVCSQWINNQGSFEIVGDGKVAEPFKPDRHRSELLIRAP